MCKQASLFAAVLGAALLFVSFNAASASPAEAQPSDRSIAESDAAVIARVDALVRDAMTESPTAGLSVGVARGGKRLLVRGWGYADVENDVPATAETVYCIGSISKQFGAAAVLRLVEAGRLSLEDDLRRWLPGYPTHGKRITAENLLRHTSGIQDFEYWGDWPKSMGLERTDEQMVATFKDLPLLFEPGTRWSYSTSGYYLVGLILARASGRTLPETLASEVFSRAGLTATRPCDHRALIPHRARGYTPTKDGLRPADLQILWQFSIAGGICSTAGDLLTWTAALERGEVVSADSYQRMISGSKLADGSPVDYGYGLSAFEYAGHRVIAHAGYVAGFSGYLSHYPDADLTIAALANTDTRAAHIAVLRIADLLLAVPPVTAVPIDAAALKVYVGKYGLVERESLTVETTEAGLKLRGNGWELDLQHVGADTFSLPDRSVIARFVVEGSRAKRIVIDGGAGLRMNFEAWPATK